MHPILFFLDGQAIYAYGVMLGLAVGAAAVLLAYGLAAAFVFSRVHRAALADPAGAMAVEVPTGAEEVGEGPRPRRKKKRKAAPAADGKGQGG